MRFPNFVILAVFAAGTTLAIGLPRPIDAGVPPALPVIAANDNRIPAGSQRNGTMYVALVAHLGRWFPDGPGTLAVPIAAFGQPGQPLQIPAPLLRVPAGTIVVLTLRNEVGWNLRVHGFVVGSDGDRPILVRSGQSRTIRFTRSVPGTYGYWCGDERDSFRSRFDVGAALTGAIVVDEPHRPRPDDRVFVLGAWDHVWRADGTPNFGGEMLTINGLSWPATERVRVAQGSTVRWRIYNASIESHPMHLHGFPFTIDSVGDGLRSISYEGKPAYREVTHRVGPGETYEAHWVADRAGEWMYHCHIAVHTIPHRPLASLIAGHLEKKSIADLVHLPHGSMGSMMLAVRVLPGPHPAAAVARVAKPRTFGIDVVETAKPANETIAFDRFAYVVHDAATDVRGQGTLGPLILLNAGDPVAITVTNHLREATTVHWHGIAVQHSVDDGGMLMDGMQGMTESAPPVEPGGSFVAHFTPTTPGTYLYHTHMDDVWQLVGGLSGPLIVLPRGTAYDATTDHVVMLTSPPEHPLGDAVSINGFLEPPPLVVHVGVPQRLRLINMTLLNSDLVVSLDGAPTLAWTPIAKDGMDLDPALRIPRRAVQQLTIGETRDFTFVASEPGKLVLDAFDGGPVGAIPIDVEP